MKVYCVFRGEYSDRTLEAIFSTKRKAEAYIKRMQSVSSYYLSVDDEPIEYELNETAPCEHVRFYFWPDGEMEQAGFDGYQEPYINYGKVHVTVKYNPDNGVMEKAARDAYYKFKASQENL